MKKIKIKLTRSEMVAIYEFTLSIVRMSPAVGMSAQLVREIMWYTIFEMERQLNNYEQKKFTLKWYGFQAVAFMAMYQNMDLDKFLYEQVIIRKIFEEINQSTLNQTV